MEGKWEQEDAGYIRRLSDFGLNYLTGEACGLSMRGLYDVTPYGEKLIYSFLGGCVPTADKMNGRNLAEHSMMISAGTARDLFIYALLWSEVADYVIEVTSTYGGREHQTIRWYKGPQDQLRKDLEIMRGNNNLRLGRSYQRSNAPGDGMRNMHMWTGRMI